MEGSLGSILSRQHGRGPDPQLSLQQRLTPHALSSNPCSAAVIYRYSDIYRDMKVYRDMT